MDKYTKYARIYPSVAGMLIPAIMMTMFMSGLVGQVKLFTINLSSLLGIFVSMAIVYSALGYFLRELFRSTSKYLFQFPLFKEDETKMPTTELLLWKNHFLSTEYHNSIARRIRADFKINLFSPEEEKNNEPEARLRIVNAIQLIREKTRGNEILLQYNYEFGFCRNYLGASIWSILFLTICEVANVWGNYFQWWIGILLITLQLGLLIIVFVMLKVRGRTYAKELISAYMA